MATEEEEQIHDVLIVGAGPCGFAVAARLREHTPSALFTDDEHNRYHWIAKHATRATIKNRKTGALRRPPSVTDERGGLSMLVLDSSGTDWMVKWNAHFDALEIKHLRSPMFFHPDPQDRDGLLAFAHGQGRACECVEIGGCVGQEISKHKRKKRIKNKCEHGHQRPPLEINERDREDYYTPGTQLFRDYCDCVAGRYGLCKGLIRQEILQDIRYCEENGIFTASTNVGMHRARAVVLAVGAGNSVSMPAPFPEESCECAYHAFQCPLPCQNVSGKTSIIKRNNVLVIGGGLTSAQVVDRAIRHGIGHTKAWHLIRGNLKVKPFDVDLTWMSKFRNVEKGAFWSADSDAERMQQINLARGGGSITPRFDKLLKQHIKQGSMLQFTQTVVKTQQYDPETKQWTVTTEPPIDGLPKFDQVYFATGVQSDLGKLAYLKSMLEKYPIPLIEGLPVLTDDLQWSGNVPLFVTGKFSGLRLGPGAGNLEGARLGAERIAWAIGEMMERERRKSSTESSGSFVDEFDTDEYRYAAGIGSRFASLSFID